MLYGRKFSTYKMGIQVPHRVKSEVSQEDHLQPAACGYTTVYPRLVEMEGRRDLRRTYDGLTMCIRC